MYVRLTRGIKDEHSWKSIFLVSYFLRFFFGLLPFTSNPVVSLHSPPPCRNDNALSTACFLTFSGTFSQYTSSRLPSTCSAAIGLRCEADAKSSLIRLSDEEVPGCASLDPEVSNPVVCTIGLEERSCTSCWACKGVHRRTWHFLKKG